jgi:Mg-chelatase subunit ChlD
VFRLSKLLGFVCVLFSAAIQGQISAPCAHHTILAGAFNTQSVPVSGLVASSFRGSYHGQSVNILSSEFIQEPAPRVVVLLDTSGSMGGGRRGPDPNKWRTAVRAASEFVHAAPPRARVSLFTFATKVEKKFDLVNEHKAIEESLSALMSQDISALKGKTALFEAIHEALDELEPVRVGDAIYVVTDGGENASEESKSRIELALQKSGVRLFAFLLNDEPRPESEEEIGLLDLQDLALESGGFGTSDGPFSFGRSLIRSSYSYDEKVASQLRAWSHALNANIGTFYVLQIETPQTSPKPKKWTLEIVDSEGRKRKDITVLYPHSLAGCGTQSNRR